MDASTDRMNGSKRSTRVHSGSVPSPPSSSSPSLRLTAAAIACGSAGSWLTYTHSPPFMPAALVAVVGSAKRLTRPAHELVVKKLGWRFTRPTMGLARSSTCPARLKSPLSAESSARVWAFLWANAPTVDVMSPTFPRATLVRCEPPGNADPGRP